MKIMLVGGTGVLSKDIAKQCLKTGHELYMINRGTRKNLISETATLVVGDVSRPNEFAHQLEGLKFDVVVDFLSYDTIQLSKTVALLKNKCTQFIFISSATVYSRENVNEPITEGTPKTNTQWVYSKNKIECEELLKELYADQPQHYTIVRPYITYGNTRIPFALISAAKQWTLADRILNNKPVVIWDDGSAKCTLTHTEDFAKAMIGLFLNEKAYEEDFHITSDEILSWKSVIKTIARALDCEVNMVSVASGSIEKRMQNMKGELTEDKAYCRLFDNTKIKSVVKEFECSIDFKNGIKDTIEYYRANKNMQKIDRLWNYKIEILIRETSQNSKQGFIKKILIQLGIVRYEIAILIIRLNGKVVRIVRRLLKR